MARREKQVTEKISVMRSGFRLVYCLAAFLFFLCGMAIYTFFRDSNFLLFRIFPKPPFLDNLYIPVKTSSVLILFLIYNLPDGLWFLSGLMIIRAVWAGNNKWRIIYSGIFFLMALLLEVFQFSGCIPGTFDIFDIITMILFAFAEGAVCNIFFMKRI